MSNRLRAKKKKEKFNTYPDIVKMCENDRFDKLVRGCFYKIFRSMQLCSWYVLYAPEFFGWDYDTLKKFSERMETNDSKFAEESYEYEQAEKKLSTELGFDIKSMSRNFPYEAKIKMYSRRIKPQDAPSVIKCINSAIECSYFLVLYTLYSDFAVDKEDLVDKFIPDLLTISHEYAYGMTDNHLIRYFCEVEEWEIFEENGKKVVS